MIQRMLGGQQQTIEIQRLLYEVKCSVFQSLYSRLYRAVPGNHHHRHILAAHLLNTIMIGGQELQPVHLGHFDVGEYEVVNTGKCFFQPLLTILRHFYCVALEL